MGATLSAERRAWVERLIAACDGAIERLATEDKAVVRGQLEDLHDLRDRLRSEHSTLGG